MSIIPTLSKDINRMTELEKEKALSKLHHQEDELLGEMGQDSDKKALPTVQTYVKDRQKADEKQKEIDLEKLKLLSSNRIAYQRYLVATLYRFIQEEDIPKKYSLLIDSNDQGIVLNIEKTPFVKAFKVSGIPFYDIYACKVLATQLGNTVAKLEGNVTKTPGGVIIPDAIDKQTYGQRNNKS